MPVECLADCPESLLYPCVQLVRLLQAGVGGESVSLVDCGCARMAGQHLDRRRQYVHRV